MKVVVLGATGHMGSATSAALTGRGHDVVPVSRGRGVDVVTGAGLDDAMAGTDIVLDCLNVATVSARSATRFFAATTAQCLASARRQGVARIVVLSIVNVTDEAVRRALGYYAGKAVQEEAYVAADLPVTVVATTAWFSIADQFLTQARIGPIAAVPSMMLQPVHPDSARDALVHGVEEAAAERIELGGPERIRADVMAREYAAATGRAGWVLGVPFPGCGFRRSALLPGASATLDPRTFGAWLAEVGRVSA